MANIWKWAQDDAQKVKGIWADMQISNKPQKWKRKQERQDNFEPNYPLWTYLRL